MAKTSARKAAVASVRRTAAGRAAAARAPDAEFGLAGASLLDDVAFGCFAGSLVLAFTLRLANQFALPKLLGLAVYVVFAAVRWGLAARRGGVRSLPRPLRLAAWALPIWWIAILPTAQHLPTAVFGMHGRSNGLATMLAGLAVFAMLATTRLTSRQVERRLAAIGAALTVASLYALVQAAGLDPIPWPEGRPASTLGHPVVFGGVLAVALPFAVAFSLGARSRRSRLTWGAVAVVEVVALAMTLARAAWVATLCGLVLLAVSARSQRRAFAPRLARLALAGALSVAAILAVSKPTRAALVTRAATIASLGQDHSVAYRLHFCRAALAMLGDHALVGVGWENFGLLYPRYRSSPTVEVESDLVPTMVHSGPLQTAVSGGVPALLLLVFFLVAIAVAIARRRSGEAAGPQRLLGDAFLASLAAYVVQDLSGWPHVALATLALAIWGLGVAWSQESRAETAGGARWPLLALATAIALGGAWLSLDTWSRIRGERRMFRAGRLDVHTAWASVEDEIRAALAVSPDRAWASDAAAKLYAERAAIAGDRRAYERGVELADAARVANPFDPYIRLRRAELDRIALFHGLIARMTDEGRQALDAAKNLAAGSAVVEKVEASLLRGARNSRIVWIEPETGAGFGPEGSLVVAGSAPKALPGTRVTLHWRDVTLGTPWVTQPDSPVPDAAGVWYNAIPGARVGDRYEVYATCETQAVGPCTYQGNGSITLCAPLAFIDPNTSRLGPPGSLLAAGSMLEAWAGKRVFLHWRDATRGSAWAVRPFHANEGDEKVSFPRDAPGNWLSVIADANPADRYQVYLSSPPTMYEPCAYEGDGSRRYCAPIAAIQPQAMAGFGPAGSLVVAGSARDVWAGKPVFLHWRNATRRSAWTTEAYAPVPDATGTWYNFIPHADVHDRYDVLITSPTTASETCTYEGDGSRVLCP
jgi:O-antigen ligase